VNVSQLELVAIRVDVVASLFKSTAPTVTKIGLRKSDGVTMGPIAPDSQFPLTPAVPPSSRLGSSNPTWFGFFLPG
jgi:hypothetical protein